MAAGKKAKEEKVQTNRKNSKTGEQLRRALAPQKDKKPDKPEGPKDAA